MFPGKFKETRNWVCQLSRTWTSSSPWESLTFQNNFAKTVTFSGREIAKILGIHSVHGKFYQRLKMAMDRFIALRFRGLRRARPAGRSEMGERFSGSEFLPWIEKRDGA